MGHQAICISKGVEPIQIPTLERGNMITGKRTIGKLALEAGVGVETIRYYERRGLLEQPARRGAARVYGDEALWRVRYVKVAQNWGLSLREMKMLLAGAERSPNFCASIRAAAGRRIDAIDIEMTRLATQRAELSTFVSTCAAKADADRCPIFQRINRTDQKNTRSNGRT
jgi:MerR family mercuric resistance operon transcriptional regulator